MVTKLVTKSEVEAEALASSRNVYSCVIEISSFRFFTGESAKTHTLTRAFMASVGVAHTLGEAGIHTPVSTTTHTLGFDRLSFVSFSYSWHERPGRHTLTRAFMASVGVAHTLGGAGIHTPVSTTTHTLDSGRSSIDLSYIFRGRFSCSTHTLGGAGIHTPVSTTTHTLGATVDRPLFFSCSSCGLSNAHTLGTTTHTLDLDNPLIGEVKGGI